MNHDGQKWVALFARWLLGLIFLMAGVYKVFSMTPMGHAELFFIEWFKETWIPVWMLWPLGVTIPFVELVAGAMLCLGLRVRDASIALGTILVIVTYGHLLREPLFDTTSHIFPRFILLAIVLLIPRDRDVFTLDHMLARRSDSQN